MKSEKGIEKTNRKKILAAVALLFALLIVKQQTTESFNQEFLQRKEPGEGNRQESLEAIVDGKSYDVNVEIAERQFTKKEAKNELKAARKEIDETFIGNNQSINCIKKPVVMKSSYQNGNVEAEWRLDSYEVINAEGEFVKKELPKKGVLIEACVVLSCGEEKEEYCFGFHAFSPDLSVREQIETALEKQNRKDKTKKNFILPKKLGKKEIQWKAKSSHTVGILLLLGAVTGILLKFRGIEEERKKKKKREEELLLYYPQLVTTLALLIGAGMPVSKAWGRMANRYKKEGMAKNAAYEELCYTWNEMQDGVGERKAYENFGKRCGFWQYKKLASLLTQNLRKGSSELSELLSKEAELAMEQRKNLAKRLGEEAGTKLLLPMMLMLSIIMVLIIVPGLIKF